MSNPDDPRSWIDKAHGDLRCIRNNLGCDIVPWDIIAYHSQQAAEKALKAILAGKGVQIPHTHDLGRLLGDSMRADVQVQHLAEDCDLLTPYAVASRYPGDEPDIDEVRAREAHEAAERIVDAVIRILQLE